MLNNFIRVFTRFIIVISIANINYKFFDIKLLFISGLELGYYIFKGLIYNEYGRSLYTNCERR